MKVAVVGAGQWGRNLVRHFHEMGALQAVVEVDAETRKRLMAEYPGLVVYEDCSSVLDSSISAVALASPAFAHYSQAKVFLEAGKDVFVEKPMTLLAGDAQVLVDLAAARDRVLMAGHLLLYQPCVRWIKAYLESGELGELRSLHQERLNLGRVRSVENVLWSFGVHDVAVMLHLVGMPPERVWAHGQRVLQPEIEDDVRLRLGFPGGVEAYLHASWLWPVKKRQLVVVGSRGMLVYDEAEQAVTLHRKGVLPDLRIRDEGQEVAFRSSQEPLRLELEEFLSCVQDRRAPVSDGRSAIPVISILAEATRLLKGEETR